MIAASPAEMLKIFRQRKEMTQEELVEEIKRRNPKLKVYQVMISRYEKNKEEPSEEIKRAINEVLEETIWETGAL
ncbi:helix-turn-helix transcriptional regulator [Paenibacillus sp. Y412MC10]|uniref:helix-turn-helix domain-containing protein n=1 Tax=Geobacillus sp. (strain Y412MC10) TaxID=481743 RepID=UPI0021B49B7F|nr:helix-turn-helix transcriptional regulator [Paenibacillus sp. Y412MC10]